MNFLMHFFLFCFVLFFCFFLTLQVLHFQKFIVGKISHTGSGWMRGRSTMFNLRKNRLVFCYISLCIIFFSKIAYISSIIHRKFEKKIVGKYDNGTHFKVIIYWDFMFQILLLLFYHLYRYK